MGFIRELEKEKGLFIRDLLRNIRYGRPVIIVSGLPRSGTSMLMKMLEAGGVDIASDGHRIADSDNPKGYYELERVKELDKGLDKTWVKELRGKAVKIISHFLKDLPGTNNYKIIFIERNIQEVIASQNKMLINRDQGINPEKDKQMVQYFERHLEKTKTLIATKPWFKACFVNHQDVIKNPEVVAKRVNQFLGGRLDIKGMAEIVDPELYRNRLAGR